MSRRSPGATFRVQRMTFAALNPSASVPARRAPRLAVRSALVLCAAISLASCSVFDDFNPFGGEKYKMIIEPDVPASKVYDQGLAKLANGAPSEAAKKFTDLGTKFPDSDWARKGLLMTTYAQFQARRLRQRGAIRRALREALSQVDRGRLRALSPGEFVLQSDSRRFARPGTRGQGSRRFKRSCRTTRIRNTSTTPNSRFR